MTSPSLVCTVSERTLAAMCRERDVQAREADLVELRIDALRDRVDIDALLAGRTKPVVVTCRPRWEGGEFGGSEDERRRLLRTAMDRGAEYVDVEWRAAFSDELVAVGGGKGVVVSMHDFDGIPRDLEGRMRRMLARGPEVVKVAVTATCLGDCIHLASAAAAARGAVADARAGRPAMALIAMGAPGVPTRVLPGRFGSCWTYAGCSAPGQLPASDLLGTYRFRGLSDATGVFGVAGHPVASSLSPAMHNAWFQAIGIDAVYLPLDTTRADDLMAFAGWLPLDGVSVTAPLKRAAYDAAAETDALSQRVGALNTLRTTSGDRRSASSLGGPLDNRDLGPASTCAPATFRTARRDPVSWRGINTDVDGFLAPLGGRLDLASKRVAIIGAGGAAQAVAIACADRGARVSVHARRREAAERVAALAGGVPSEVLPTPGSWDVLVNATPLGSRAHPDETPVPNVAFDGELVYDLVSNPPVTRLLRDAAAAGCATVSGLEMLVAQAELQAEWWTGLRPTPGLMRAAAERVLGSNG